MHRLESNRCAIASSCKRKAALAQVLQALFLLPDGYTLNDLSQSDRRLVKRLKWEMV